MGTKSTAPAYTLRIEREKLDRLQEIARLEHRSAAQVIRRLIDQRLDAHEFAPHQAGTPDPSCSGVPAAPPSRA